MRQLIFVLFIGLFLAAPLSACDDGIHFNFGDGHPKIEVSDSVYVYFHHSDLFIESEKDDKEIIISNDYRLYIDNELIKTNKKEKQLVQEYYELADYTFDQVIEICDEAGEIGIEGAALGAKAVARVFKLILPGFDSDDLEREIEDESKEIEKKAKKLEEKGGKLESVVEHLKECHEQLFKEIFK